MNQVREIGKKMEVAVSAFFSKKGGDDPTKNFGWDYILVDNDKVVNAWCMPGGKIAIYTGTNEVWVNPPKGSWMPLEVGSAGITLNLDETAYICVTFKRNTDVSNIIGFKNGVKVVETTSSGADEGGISGYTLGSRSDFNGEYLPIEVYHATVHERALTEQEVAQNFEALRRRVTISSGIPHGT